MKLLIIIKKVVVSNNVRKNAIVKYILWELDEYGEEWDYELSADKVDKDYAIETAKENACINEVIMAVWNNEEDYQNGKPADFFEVIWRR